MSNDDAHWRAGLAQVTINEMIEEITNELAYRERSYPDRMQGAGLALRNKIQRRLEVIRAILAHLEAERDRQ